MDKDSKKPYKSYNGGKEGDGCYQKIINLIPPHDLYIEGFLGNGAILRKKKPSAQSVGMDIDPKVIEKWGKIEIPGLTLLNVDTIKLMEHFAGMQSIIFPGKRLFMYLDPPYPFSTRRSQLELYANELSDFDHLRLLTAIKDMQFPVMISTYPNELYSEKLIDWTHHRFTVQTRRGPAQMDLYTNYTDPDTLHDYSFIGNDFRQREQFKGIVKRNVAKFRRMPPVLKNALIEKLLSN